MIRPTLDRCACLDKLEAGTHVLMPAKADGEMLRAIWNYYSSRLKYQDRKDDTQLKADCWMALMAYDVMVDLFKSSAPQGTPVVPDETESPAGAEPLDLKDAPTSEMWVESPDMFLDGWGGKHLPPSFHAYAMRLYAAYKRAMLLEPASKFNSPASDTDPYPKRGGGGSSN